jgi:hypothetical protein
MGAPSGEPQLEQREFSLNKRMERGRLYLVNV